MDRKLDFSSPNSSITHFLGWKNINFYSEISIFQMSVMGPELVVRSEISVIWGFYDHSGCLGMKILPLSPQNAQFWWVYNQLLAGKQHWFFCSIVIFCQCYWANISNRIAPIAKKNQVHIKLRYLELDFQGNYSIPYSLREIRRNRLLKNNWIWKFCDEILYFQGPTSFANSFLQKKSWFGGN